MKKILTCLILFFALSWEFCVGFCDLKAYFLDVGQGDAAIIVCDGCAMMIDGGPPEASQKIFTVLRDVLRLDYLDVIIASHPHTDHIGGIAAALNAVPVGVIYTPIDDYDSRAWASVVKYADLQGTPIVVPMPGDFFDLGGAKVEILAPLYWHNELNNLSLVVRVSYGEKSLLFTGDMESDGEQDLLDAGICVEACVLKVAHHGSESSSSAAFIRSVGPEYAIISVGANSYGHPADSTLLALERAGCRIFRTDAAGDIMAMTDGKHVACMPFAPKK